MDDVLILGGGVIGLSLAYELSRHGQQVRLIDRGQPGSESSWAGAGILPPAVRRAGDHPLEQLAGLSHEMHPRWAEQLQAETGIDTGYRRCGGLYLARDRATNEELESLATAWREQGIEVHRLTSADLATQEPLLSRDHVSLACLLPDECQLRNPRHLRALIAACQSQGVMIEAGVAAEEFVIQSDRVLSVVTSSGPRQAGRYCITSGAWTGSLMSRLGCRPDVRPIRGQIVLLSAGQHRLHHIVNDGPRYLVPRGDGRILIGSTEEDAGFDKRTTTSGVQGLLAFALSLAPALESAEIETYWAGLRPCSRDGLPYLGRVPNLENAFVAAGHFRQGLHLSCGTAVVMGQLLRDLTPEVDLSCFGLAGRCVGDRPITSNPHQASVEA